MLKSSDEITSATYKKGKVSLAVTGRLDSVIFKVPARSNHSVIL